MSTAATRPVAVDSSALRPEGLPDAFAMLLARLGTAPVDPATSVLVDAAVAVWRRPGFDSFLSLPQLSFVPFEYQMQTARTVLRRMRGRAILADEVGLGKTIEAGLVLSELRMRGLADRTLVLTPAGLVEQWREELERKFGLPTVIARGREWADADAGAERPVVLASIASARREPLKSRLTTGQWDVVVADEAHRLRNPRSASGKLARALRARYLLLLTATPVENRLQDLYELVSLVAPGLLGTPAQFRQRHAGAGTDPSLPRNLDALRASTREVMVRHRRSEVEVLLPQRLAETVLVAPSQEEAELYAGIAARIRAEAKGASSARLLTLRGLTRLAGSSPQAAAPTLAKAGWPDLAALAREIEGSTKAELLLERLRRHNGQGEKVLVFTAFRQTLDALAARLEREGVQAAVYHGSLSRRGKEAAVAAFRDQAPVLLSTESAGEGRNLQFCHVMANVDLPWNPMQIEQRLGRLHRVGQEHDVVLTNLVARGTIEQRILHVLESKINLFELVVGELDMILGRVDEDFDFEASVFDAFATAGDDAEFEERLERLGERLVSARTDYLDSRGAIDALVGGDDEREAGR
ncbi:DEAD/DEAH box helicase [Streptomyces sp. P17]|uniref:DEAD/DEAH box helicase n=1 Tax=Streptomyces sp. P17 TaxID=3074716 RepID=UPI0028F41276|nr:DEAD/DEAH box helicase [Streptomyces sp. P17]MDT9701665.1 DEAD/DEAH box helicase [Streptomyces sp. P17]